MKHRHRKTKVANCITSVARIMVIQNTNKHHIHITLITRAYCIYTARTSGEAGPLHSEVLLVQELLDAQQYVLDQRLACMYSRVYCEGSGVCIVRVDKSRCMRCSE